MTDELIYVSVCARRALEGNRAECPLIEGLAAWTRGDEIALAQLELRRGATVH
jgi:hypothetical protein